MKRIAFSMACASALAWGATAHSDEPEKSSEPTPEQLFDSLDANHDGTLAADEVGDDRRRFFERLVRIGDKNSDNQLSREEFVAATSDNQSERDEPANDRGGPRRGIGQMFERLDHNHDGKLTRDEIPEQLPAPAREHLLGLFDQLGKDEITRDDLRESANPGQRFAPRGDQYGIVRMLKEWDKNGDDKVSRDELPEPARPRLNFIFERLGKDELSFEEFVAGYHAMQNGRGPEADGDRPPRPDDDRDGDRRPPEGDGRGPDGQGGPGFGGGFRGRFGGGFAGGFGPGGPGAPNVGPLFMRLLDADHNGRISRAELAKAVEKFGELDHNDDGEIDMQELMGFPGAPPGDGNQRFGGPGRNPQGARGPGDEAMGNGPDGRRGPDGDRPDGRRGPDGDRPDGPRGPDGDRPDGRRGPDGDRPVGRRGPDGDRPDGRRGPDGDRPDGPRGPDGDRPDGRRGPDNRRGDDATGFRPRGEFGGDRQFPGRRDEFSGREGGNQPGGDRRPPDGRDFDRPPQPGGDGRPRGPQGNLGPGGEPGGPREHDRSMIGHGPEGPEFLRRADRDHDGAISRDEAPEKMRDKFDELDADHDGRVTFDEFGAAIAREYGFAEHHPE